MEEVDLEVVYNTLEKDLETDTKYDFPNKDLQVEILELPNQSEQSVSGNYRKEKDFYATEKVYTKWLEKDRVYATIYETLVPEESFKDYLNVPVADQILKDINDQLRAYDNRYGLMMEHVKTIADVAQFFVDFRWKRFNVLDHYIPFSKYSEIVINNLEHIAVPTDFPVLIDGPTILKAEPRVSRSEPFYIDYPSGTIVVTDDYYKATMFSGIDGTISMQSLNRLNFSVNWADHDWLITNNKNWIQFTTKDQQKKAKLKFHIDNITGVRYSGDYFIVYILGNYAEHAIVIDKDFKIVEDSYTRVFDTEIIKLFDPKTIIFRDKYQYYCNNEDGSYATFPLQDMVDINNNIVKKYTIRQTTFDKPMPISIVDGGPRINAKYGSKYMMTWSYNATITLMTIYPAFAYTFNKDSFYNPRKYLTNRDYNEACIPLHGGFRRTSVIPLWMGTRPGFVWESIAAMWLRGWTISGYFWGPWWY